MSTLRSSSVGASDADGAKLPLGLNGLNGEILHHAGRHKAHIAVLRHIQLLDSLGRVGEHEGTAANSLSRWSALWHATENKRQNKQT